jgi:chromosome condensin MukBEF ATPase and DNA-binding subunit MukB
MKKVALLLTSLSLLLVSSLTHAAMCDETFYGKLRAGNAYSFYDDMTNRTGKYVFVNNVAWEFLPQYNY